ncbi:hypothetical protein [Rhodococcus ruber]|uniref:hypothetical protein n=1 Tax=Rhodococcus ruber TaxID=1830 RepID=UPI000F531717|nr:hypothetical protein [Rhodococcus ruber]RQM32250.1 hypothetical protein TN91_21585 [Rhodococcus ruber]
MADAFVRLVHDGRWGVDETSTGLVSPAGVVSVRGSAAVLAHVYSHVPAWLVPELGSEPLTGVVDLHERLADIDDDPVLEELAGRYESVFEAMDCAFGTGWDLVMNVASHGGSARIEMSTAIPSDLSGGFLQYVGDCGSAATHFHTPDTMRTAPAGDTRMRIPAAAASTESIATPVRCGSKTRRSQQLVEHQQDHLLCASFRP